MSSQLALVVGLVALNAVLAGTEMALVSLRDTQVERLARESVAGARLAQLAANPSRFLATIQVGITLAGFGASASAAVSLADPVEDALVPFVGEGAAAGVAVALVTVVLSFLTLVLGELVPKRIAMQAAERWALLMCRPLQLLQTLTAPAVWLLEHSSNAVVRLLGFDPHAEAEEVTEEELRDMVVGHEDLSPFQRQVLDGAFEVAERRVGQVLTPRRSVVLLDGALPAAEARRVLAASGFSRAPVTGAAGLDQVVGVVHLRDLLDVAGDANDTAADRAGEPTVLPETAKVLDALRMLQGRRAQLAVVVDEHGGAEGIVTVEDLVEELVGEIFDESDPDHQTVRHRGNTIIVPGSFPAHDLVDVGVQLPDGPYATVAGFVLDRLGHLPERPGVTVETDEWQLTVVEVDDRQIIRVTLTPIPVAEDADDAEDADHAQQRRGADVGGEAAGER